MREMNERGRAPEADIECSVQEAMTLIRDDSRTVIIDIRSSAEVCLGYLRGARFVPLGLIEGESNKLTPDREAPVLVYCAAGDRSIEAADRLRRMGFKNARSIAGGYNAWLNADGEVVSDGRFTVHQLNRYSRTMLLDEIGEEGQLKLVNARVLLVGAGGLASSALLYLAACGVGAIGIIDFDRVDLSNLNRQVIHGTDDVGRLKVDSAKQSILEINPDVKVITFPERLVAANAMEIINGFDIVMDATDNLDTKFLLNDACYFAGKPYVFGGAVRFEGQAGVFWPKEKGPCLRCLFREPPARHLVPT